MLGEKILQKALSAFAKIILICIIEYFVKFKIGRCFKIKSSLVDMIANLTSENCATYKKDKINVAIFNGNYFKDININAMLYFINDNGKNFPIMRNLSLSVIILLKKHLMIILKNF
jgi:hypothetical protein